MPKRPTSASAPSEPSSKRAKPSATPKIISAATIKAKQDKAPVSSAAQTDDDGNTFWELNAGGMRRVTVSEFKGTTMVAVREYYVDKATGQHKPTSKGLSLPIDQWAALVEVLPQIEAALVKEGHSVPRPQYDDAAPVVGAHDNDEEDEHDEEAEAVDKEVAPEEADEEEEEEAPPAEPQKPAKKEQKSKKEAPVTTKAVQPSKPVKEVKKKNYEATDDEEEVPTAGSASSKLAKFMHG